MIEEGDKSGLSTIVATLITILLVLVAVAIIWTVIRAFIQKSTEEITLSKFTVDLEIDSVRITNESVNVKVKRNPGDGDLKGITFIIFDGQNSHIIERKGANFSLEQLEKKTFVLDYTGSIVKISIAPMFETKSGKLVTGSIADVYYVISFGTGSGTGGGNWSENCTSDCGIRQCGPVPNGCGTSCGVCPPEDPYCENGVCTDTTCTPGCSCAATLCIGQTCPGGCGESCPGELISDCGEYDCGTSPNGCGDCGSCETGYHCDAGICVVSCIPDCGTRECGLIPNGCPEGGVCGYCNTTEGEWCDNGYCSNETCTPDCGTRNCGPVPNACGENCGICNETLGEYCSDEGVCLVENYLNTGTVYSVWPINIGIYFDSQDLPKSGVDYSDYYVKFPTSSETRCLQIREFVTPVIPEVYNMSYIRFVTSSTEVQSMDIYQIWETYQGCTS